MDKHSVAQDGGFRKCENGGRGNGTSPPPAGAPPPSGEAEGRGVFTAAELAELAGFDAALDAEEVFLTPEERKLSRELDRAARAEAETEDGGWLGLRPSGGGPSSVGFADTFPKGKAGTGEAARGREPGKARTGDGGRGDRLPRRCAPHKDKTPETAAQRAARLERMRLWREAHREKLRLDNARYNETHRQERRDYQRAYDAAHREEINARRRQKDAEKRKRAREARDMEEDRNG